MTFFGKSVEEVDSFLMADAVESIHELIDKTRKECYEIKRHTKE